jgi:hypothetical protein
MIFTKLRFVSLSLLLSLPAIAETIDPSAQWLGPWAPVLGMPTLSSGLGADASASRDFGPVGDAEALSGISASAFGRALVDSGTFGSASASTFVTFSRSFQLMGSPDGWNVTISGRLVGLLLTASSSLPSASVSASARVVGGPAVNWGTITLAPDLQRAIDQGMSASSTLADGTYLVQGSLDVSADISAAGLFSSNGRALSDFFAPRDGPAGLFVGVDATPIPEPQSMLLLVVAGGVLLFGRFLSPRRWCRRLNEHS